MKKSKIILIVCICSIIYFLLLIAASIGIPYIIYKSAKPKINTDISKYNDYIGENAIDYYRNKWDMDETIFPQNITDSMQVEDYKMVYYNPWDAQYLSYLVVNYSDEDYEKEIERLKRYNSTEYKGYYGVTGFDKYDLVAIYADSYQGFVYALTDNKNKIIYVEIIFCNYFMDIDYNEYINIDYLPTGFDATLDNKYEKQMMKNR